MADQHQYNGAWKIISIAMAMLGSFGTLAGIVTIANYVIDWKMAATVQIIADMKAEWVQTRELQSRRGQELIDLRANERHLEEEVASLRKQVDELTKRRR